MTEQEREALLRKVAELWPHGTTYQNGRGATVIHDSVEDDPYELTLTNDIEDAPAMVLIWQEMERIGNPPSVGKSEGTDYERWVGGEGEYACWILPSPVASFHVAYRGGSYAECTVRAFVAVMEAREGEK